jgi:hypothetical protein
MGNPLPKLMVLNDFNGNWDKYLDAIYQVFLEEVVNGKLTYNDLPIRVQFRPMSKGKGYGFWHLIQEGEIEEDREPDLRRCERIRWIAWVIKNLGEEGNILWWISMRGSSENVVLWHKNENYAVILAKRNNYFLLKTAYVVKPNRAITFAREWNDFQKKAGAA